MNTSSLKRVSAFAAAILLICTLFVWTAAVGSHAKSFSEMNEDGYVTDGARGDRPGIIGDERDTDRSARTPAGAYGRNNGNSGNGSGLTGNDIPGSTAAEDFLDDVAGGIGRNQNGNRQDDNAAVLGAQDFAGDGDTSGDVAMRTFWGIVIALIVAAVVLALVFLLMPKNRSTER